MYKYVTIKGVQHSYHYETIENNQNINANILEKSKI